MSEKEYVKVFHHQYEESRDGIKNIKRYQHPLNEEIRLQMALLHNIKGDYTVDIDFEKKERE